VTPPIYITTSWDDGHPLDLRLAELLHKYGLPATFYIPLENQLPVLTQSQVRELSGKFEVGAHTVHHCDLLTMPDHVTRMEITDCKN
jgi:peptidoglycan/xylan/chitin deacetylase (PgdA/CDA1 family)